MAREITVFEGGGRAHDTAGELAAQIKTLVYQQADKMPLATAIGVLEIVKIEILNEQ